MDDEIEKNIKELGNVLISAGLNYEIWWVYKEKDSRKRFVDTLNDYPLFFQTSLHALCNDNYTYPSTTITFTHF